MARSIIGDAGTSASKLGVGAAQFPVGCRRSSAKAPLRRTVRSTALHLITHRNAQSAQIGALFVAQYDDLPLGNDRSAGFGCAVDAGNIVRAADIADRTLEVRF